MMRQFLDIRDCLRYRMNEDADSYFADAFWEEEVKIFCSDLGASINFVKSACTDEELYWLGEVFDDILEKTKSHELLDALRARIGSVEDATQKEELLQDLQDAISASGLG